MLTEVSLLTAFLVGLLGAVHCVGMCGGIVGALSLGIPERQRRSVARWYFLLSYNAGRLVSYTFAGALLGGIGWLASNWSGVHQAQQYLQLAAAIFMVALGLYLGGWWQALVVLERAGGLVWARIEPLGRRFLPVKSPFHALVLGLLWGWLPCGLVYSVLVWSIAAGDPLRGAGIMLAFGIGTLPSVLLMGAAAAGLAARVRDPRARHAAGFLVILFGFYALVRWFTQ